MERNAEREAKTDMLGEELRDREMRRNNIIIHDLAESTNNINARDRMEHDRQQCGNILSTIGARTRAADLRFCRRVGERGKDARPLIIGLRSEEEKRDVLDKAAGLRRTMYDNISIGPGMTKMQRRAEDLLAKEVETRNQQLTSEDREKNLRWLVIGRRGEKRIIKGVEREQQHYERREPQLHNFMPQQQTFRDERETGARRKEYPQQQQPINSLRGPALLQPQHLHNANYTPIQHGRNLGNNTQPRYSQPQLQSQRYPQPAVPQPQGQLQQQSSNNTNTNQHMNRSNGNNYQPTDNFRSNNNSYGNGNGNGNSSYSNGNNGYNNGNNSYSNGNNSYSNGNNSYNNGINGYDAQQHHWNGGAGNNDSGYTEPQWQQQNEWQGNLQLRQQDRQDHPATESYGMEDSIRPRLNSKRGRDGQDRSPEGPPRTRSRQ
jgi:hypothetical protein